MTDDTGLAKVPAKTRVLAMRSPIAVARSHVSGHLSQRLPYYLTPDEVHRLIEAAENERDRLLMRGCGRPGPGYPRPLQ